MALTAPQRLLLFECFLRSTPALTDPERLQLLLTHSLKSALDQQTERRAWVALAKAAITTRLAAVDGEATTQKALLTATNTTLTAVDLAL
jgi:hypothetical protein